MIMKLALRCVSGQRRLMCAGIGAAILIVVTPSVLTLAYLHEQAQARVAASTRNLAKSLVHTMEGVLDAVDVALLAAADEIARQQASGRPDHAYLRRFLLTQQARLPLAPDLWASDAGGNFLYGRALPVPAAHLRAQPVPGLFLGAPQADAGRQAWVWPLARSFNTADGRFGGVVHGAFAVAHIERMLAEMHLDSGVSIVLRHAGYQAVATRSGSASVRRLPPGDIVLSPELQAALLRDREQGTYSTSRSALAATEHTFSYARSAKYGFYVWVGEANDVALAEWRRQVWLISGLALASVALAAGFLLLLGRAWQRQQDHLRAIRRLAYYDALTELPNRRLLLDRLETATAAPNPHTPHGALMLIDLDNFKILNDTQGHGQGDRLLRAVSARLLHCVRGGDTVARLGGDEFAVLCPDLAANASEARRAAAALGEAVRGALCQPFDLDGFQYAGSPSVGITLFAGATQSVDELIRRADTAMYQAKGAGRNTARFFDPAMQAAVTERLALERDLREAIGQGQFALHYQAQVEAGGRITGAEVLLRWQHPRRGMVSPAHFIPVAEATGLILPLGLWVLEAACAQLAAWAQAPATRALTLAVNVSARQFGQPDFVAQVLDVLERTGAEPSRLKLELTEGSLLDNTAIMIAAMQALKRAGVGFSLDDFGTGYSSLSYLKRLPLDQLKIDQSFVRDLLTDASDAAIVRTIVALGASLDMQVIAEGVETEAQRACLARAGCHVYQGYLFGRPLPVADFEQSLPAQAAPTCRLPA